MAKAPRKTPANDAAKSLKETEKRIRAIEKQIAKSGRLRNPKTGYFVKATLPNIRKVQKEILKDVKQSKRTLKAASKFVDTIKGFFKEKKKAGKKSTTKVTSARSVPVSPSQSPKPSQAPKGTSQKTKRKVSSKISDTAAKRQSKSPSRAKHSKSAISSRERIYEVSELPEAFRTHTANATLEEIERDAADYNALLKPGEVFGGKVGYTNEYGHFVGGYTHRIFSTIEEYIEYISKYEVFEKLGDDESEQDKILDLLQIIRFRSPQKNLLKLPEGTQYSANNVAWQQKRLKYGEKKEASKKEFKRKVRAKEKAAAKKIALRDARQRGIISAQAIKIKNLEEEREKRK